METEELIEHILRQKHLQEMMDRPEKEHTPLEGMDNEQISNHSIFRLDTHRNLTYLCAVTFNNNDYGERKSKLSGGI